MITEANSLLRLGAGLVPPVGARVRIERGRQNPYFLGVVERPGVASGPDGLDRVCGVVVLVTAVARLPNYRDEVFTVAEARISVEAGTLEILELPRPCQPLADWLRVGEVVS